jgi:hypothetical protein
MQASSVIHPQEPSWIVLVLFPSSYEALLKILFEQPTTPSMKPFPSLLYICVRYNGSMIDEMNDVVLL